VTRRVDAHLIMLTTMAMTGGRNSLAADWSQTVDAGTNIAYVTNPQLIAGSHQSDEYAQVSVDGNTVAQTEISQLTITPRLSSTHYHEESNLDINSGSIDLNYQRKLERGQWTLDGMALTDSTVTSELGTTGITNVNVRHYANNLALGGQYYVTERLGWQLQSAWQDTRYTNAAAYGLTNYSYYSLQSGPTWNLTERLLGSLTLETDRISPQNGVNQTDYAATLQLKRAFTEQYAWHVSGGATRLEAEGTNTGTSWVAELGANRHGELVQWDLSVKRAIAPIGLGLLAQENAAVLTAAITTSERGVLNLSMSAIHTDPVNAFIYLAPGISLTYQIYSGAAWGQASAEWRYQLSQRWTLSASALYARARNYSVSEWANGNQARVGIIWQSGRL
jgi:hypothetical protein